MLVLLCRRSQWLAVLFGPFGCTLRWALSKTNYRLPGKWNWLPVGTLAANMLACLIDYIAGVTRLKMSAMIDHSMVCMSASCVEDN